MAAKIFLTQKEVLGFIKYLFFNDRGEAKKRRKKWVDFVKCKRAQWIDTQYSAVCSIHFKPEDFEVKFQVGLKVKDTPIYIYIYIYIYIRFFQS